MRALFLNPDVVLLDEPMGALDPLIRSDLQQELREIFHQLKTTVVMVTHDIGEAGFLGNTIALLKDGRIVQSGSLRDLVQRPEDEFVTQFITLSAVRWSPWEGRKREDRMSTRGALVSGPARRDDNSCRLQGLLGIRDSRRGAGHAGAATGLRGPAPP